MKSTSERFRKIAESNSARYYVKYIVDDTIHTDTLNHLRLTCLENGSSDISLGNTCSASVSFSVYKPSVKLENKEITLYEGIDIGETIEYIQLGIFKITKQESSGEYTKYEGVDRMASRMNIGYFPALDFPSTDLAVLQEICEQTGIRLETNVTDSHPMMEKPEGYTCREMLGYMAALQGKNAVVNAAGNLELKWYTQTEYCLGGNKYYQDGVTFSTDDNFVLQQITCNVGGTGDNNTLTSGSGAVGITFANPFMTQSVLDEIFQKIGGFAYRPVEIRFVGDFRIEPGDIITLQRDGKDYRVPVMQIMHECDGGLISTIQSAGRPGSGGESSSTAGPATQTMKRIETELALVKYALVRKLDVETADITYASIQQLKAVDAVIDDLKANALTAETAGLKYAAIENLNTAVARITALEAGSADMGALRAQVADISSLMFGSAGGGSLTTNFSNSIVSLIGDAQIKSAMIKDIAADKITAGRLFTNRVAVCSESGNLNISDNTLLIQDDKKTARIQLGRDFGGDYSLYVWDAAGNLMFDALGLTAAGIQRPVIRNDMVSGNANISAKKLDMTSLFKEINDSVETIKSSRIYVDADKQTLDVAFQSVRTDTKESADNAAAALAAAGTLAQTVNSQGTQLTVVQGQIASRVWQQDITTAVKPLAESATALSNQYTSLNQTISGLTASVNSNTTEIRTKADNRTVTSIQSTLTVLQADLSGFKSTVSNAYMTTADLDKKLGQYSTTADVNSAIEQKAGSVLQSVSAAYATKNSLDDYATTQSVQASLELKIGKSEADAKQIISMINASADEVHLKANRFSLDSTYAKISRDGAVQFTKGTIGGFTLTEKLAATAKDVYINPGVTEIKKIRNFLLNIESPLQQEKNLYDLNGDGVINAYDLIAINSIIQGVKEYSSYKNAVPSTVNLQIDPTQPQALIKLWGTNPWGRKLEQRIGINGIDATAVRTEIVNTEELNLCGTPIMETVSGSNGFCVKFANGMMLCAMTKEFINVSVQASWGSLYESSALSLGSYPYSFSATPYISAKITNKRGTGSAAGFIEGPYDYTGSSAGEIYICRPTAGNFDFIVDLLAVGVWK